MPLFMSVVNNEYRSQIEMDRLDPDLCVVYNTDELTVTSTRSGIVLSYSWKWTAAGVQQIDINSVLTAHQCELIRADFIKYDPMYVLPCVLNTAVVPREPVCVCGTASSPHGGLHSDWCEVKND